MIYISKGDEYSVKHPLNICLDFAEKFVREEMEPGRYELQNGIYCSASISQLQKMEEFFFEAHKEYADLHYVIEGTQRMLIGDTSQMEFVSYTEEKDFVKVVGEHQVEILQTAGSAIAVFPEDAHTLDPEYLPTEAVKKIIFKIPLFLFEKDC